MLSKVHFLSTKLDTPRPLVTQSHRHSWTYQAGHTEAFGYPVAQIQLDIPSWTHQGLWLPSRTDTAGHTKLDTPRPLVTQSHRHSWTYQAGHTEAFGYPVAQIQLDIPSWTHQGLWLPSRTNTAGHIPSWTHQGLWLPSRTDTAGHTKLDTPRPLVTQSHKHSWTYTKLDTPRPLVTQSHRYSWTYQAGHTKAFGYPVAQTQLDIPSWTHQGL